MLESENAMLKDRVRELESNLKDKSKCNWTTCNGELWQSKCGEQIKITQLTLKDFKYCPYCSKEITLSQA